jgi:hypothetical protein
MSLTKLSLAGNNQILPGQEEFMVSDIPAGDGNIANLFLQCPSYLRRFYGHLESLWGWMVGWVGPQVHLLGRSGVLTRVVPPLRRHRVQPAVRRS